MAFRFKWFPSPRVFLRQQVVGLLHSQGLTDHDMAAILGVSVRTVANHRREEGLPVNRKKREARR